MSTLYVNNISPTSGGDVTISGSNGLTISGSLKIGDTTITATAAELNIMDGGNASITTTVADADRLILNDGGVMKQVSVDNFATYFANEISGAVTATTISASSTLDVVGVARFGPGNAVTIAADGGVTIGHFDANWTNAGNTVADLGIVTTVDINGGSIDGAAIGAASHTTGKFTTVDATTDFTIGSLIITDDQIQMTPSSGDTATIAAAADGVLNITTVDTAGADANIVITADGTLDLNSVALDIDATGAATIDAVGIALGAGSGELDLTTTGTLDINSAALDIDTSGAITIDAAGTASHIAIATAHTAGVAFHLDADANAGSIVDIDAGILDIDVTGDAALDSSAGSITVGAVLADGQTLKLGKNGAVETIIAPHGTAGSELYSVTNTAGDAANAISLNATAGGITLNSDATTAQDAVTIDAAQTTKAGLKLNATAMTTGDVISVDANVLTTGNALFIDHDDAHTDAQTVVGIHYDFDKAGTTGDGITQTFTGMDLDMNDAATNHANATVNLVGIDLDMASANAQGTLTNTGISLNVAGADTNIALDILAGNARIADNMGLYFGDSFEAAIKYDESGSDQLMIEVGDAGLAVKGTTAGSDAPVILSLLNAETAVAADDVLGAIRWQAPDETGTDAIVVAAAIQATAEADFDADQNETKLEFMLGRSEAATTKATLDSNGLFIANGGLKSGTAAGSGADAFLYTAGAAAHVGIQWDANGNTEGTLIGGADDHGVDFKFFGETSGKFVQWDMSGDELVLGGASKISFHDAAGDENIVASADGHLEINAGTTLDMSAPTVDINAATAVTIDTDTVTFASVNSQDPLIIIKNETNDALAGRLRFQTTRGAAAGSAGDHSGVIEFFADDAGGDNICFAAITGSVEVHTNGSEGGQLHLVVASHDGELQPGLILTDGDAEDEVDVSIANGLASVATVNGGLTVNGPLIAEMPSVHNFTGNDANATIPITTATAQIDAGGSGRTGMRFAGSGVAGQILVVINTGGESVVFHATEGTALLRGTNTEKDTIRTGEAHVFVSDGSLWNHIGGGATDEIGLTS
tara:strand:- start:1387 stop:4548 length:3162 start_codon:yes stop_codon:yes gene_type:complete